MNDYIKINEIKKGIELAIQNAFELIEDAEILYKNERFARTYSLSQLALEELGKSILLYNLYVNLQMNKRKEFNFKVFRKEFRSHKSKTFEAIMIELLMNGKGKSKLQEFKSISLKFNKKRLKNKKGHFDNLKNKSLYVSIDNNKFHRPIELFGKVEVYEFLKSSKEKIEFSSKNTLKWIRMDEWLGTDKEGIISELKIKYSKTGYNNQYNQ